MRACLIVFFALFASACTVYQDAEMEKCAEKLKGYDPYISITRLSGGYTSFYVSLKNIGSFDYCPNAKDIEKRRQQMLSDLGCKHGAECRIMKP